MGMWDKDKEIGTRPEDAFGLEQPFVLVGAEIAPEQIQTTLGMADVAVLRGRKMTPQGLGPEIVARAVNQAIVGKVRLAEPSDFPAVVQLQRVDTKKFQNVLVLSFLGPFTGEV